MSIQKLDIWNNWHRGMSVAFKDGDPVTDGYITLRADEQAGCGCGGHDCGGDCGCGGHDHDSDDCGGCGSHDHSHGGDCGCGGHEGDECGCGGHDSDECGGCGCGGHEHGHRGCGCGEGHGDGEQEEGVTVLHDALINMLYFAAFRAHCGVRVSGLGEDFEISADGLATLSAEIDLLSHVFGFKTGQISLEQFAREISGQTVYYSTLAGEDDDGDSVFFACTSGDGVDFYPVFLTEAHLREFFKAYNRSEYLIMQNSFAEFLSVLDSSEQLKELGAVVEPMLSCAVGFPPGLRV